MIDFDSIRTVLEANRVTHVFTAWRSILSHTGRETTGIMHINIELPRFVVIFDQEFVHVIVV